MGTRNVNKGVDDKELFETYLELRKEAQLLNKLLLEQQDEMKRRHPTDIKRFVVQDVIVTLCNGSVHSVERCEVLR